MGINYGKNLSTKKTPQGQPIFGKDMVQNNAGGFVFKTDPWVVLDRFLILGTEGGTYYCSEAKATVKAGDNVVACIKLDGEKALKRIIEVSDKGLCIKNDSCIIALALCMVHGTVRVRQEAYSSISKVCRIGTHLFHLASYLEDLGKGWSRGSRRGFANWYLNRKTDSLVDQVLKYRQRDGWSHRDILRLAHPVATNPETKSIFNWVTKREQLKAVQAKITAFEELQKLDPTTEGSIDKACALITEHGFQREMVPTPFLNQVKIWEALLPNMGLTAIIRNLGVLTANGTLTPLASTTLKVIETLENPEVVAKSRIHPMTVLLAIKNYSHGQGLRGATIWKPIQGIEDALENTLQLAYKNSPPTNKRFFLGIDVSGSMSSYSSGNITAAEAAAATAAVIAKREKNYVMMGFSGTFIDLGFTAKDSMQTILTKTADLNFGYTNCALPMIYALEKKIPVDVFVVLTDNETWHGNIHPTQALAAYNKLMGRVAKLVVVGFTATEFSIAEQGNPNMLDIVGMDPSFMEAIEKFAVM